jgi:type II secretory pathway predicted ATPase ExeA
MIAAFEDRDPVIVLVSRWPQNAEFMVNRFIEVLPENVTVARVTEPCDGAANTLRAILSALGVEIANLNTNLLEEELERALEKQLSDCKRTIIWFRAPDKIEPWVLVRVRRLIELEEREKYGITVILSGGPELRDPLTKPPFNRIAAKAGQSIVAGPLSLEETRDYITRQVRKAGVSNVYQVFDFAAMTVVHELSGGLTNKIDDLCCECIELADREDKRPITPAMVERAYAKMTQVNSALAKKDTATAEAGNGETFTGARLVANLNGSGSREVPVRDGHLVIGRAELSDLPLPSLLVSRQHAMVVKTGDGISLVDLGSTNGTFVDGKRVEKHELRSGDLIRVGDCTITFFAGFD